jgi:1-acyl-sn-glycerol-3-phosphate acyltransferase
MFRKLYISLYSLYFINYIGFKLKNSSDKSDEFILKMKLIFANKLFKKLNIKVNITNKEKIIKGQNYVLITNHRSIIDPLVIELALEGIDTPLGYWAAKDDLYNSPFFGTFTRNAGTILVNRKKNDTNRFLKEVKEKVSNNNSIFIFPEGTRNKTDKELLEFQGGTNIIAIKNKLDILPIYIKTNTSTVLKNAINKNKEQTIEVIIGDVISRKEKELQLKFKNEFNLK